MDREYFPSAVFFFCDLEGARGFIRGMSSYKLYIFPFKKYFRKLMMHMLLSMSAKYCAEKKAFCSNTLGGPFIPIWHLLAIPNNTKWIHSPFCLLWSSSWEKWELRQTWRFSHFECISAANLIRIAIFYLNHEFQKYLGNEFLLLKKKARWTRPWNKIFQLTRFLKVKSLTSNFPLETKEEEQCRGLSYSQFCNPFRRTLNEPETGIKSSPGWAVKTALTPPIQDGVRRVWYKYQLLVSWVMMVFGPTPS